MCVGPTDSGGSTRLGGTDRPDEPAEVNNGVISSTYFCDQRMGAIMRRTVNLIHSLCIIQEENFSATAHW